MWDIGHIKIHDSNFRYWVKVYKKGNEFGINGGKISVLILKRNGEVACVYNRGWDIEPVDLDTKLAVEILLDNYNK